MRILVINAGSSSLKYQLINMEDESVLAKGNCERIGIDGGIVTHKLPDGRSKELNVNMSNHTEAFMQVKNMLLDNEVGVLNSLSEVSAVGHRVVQGGALFSESVLVNEDVIKGIESLILKADVSNVNEVEGLVKNAIDKFGRIDVLVNNAGITRDGLLMRMKEEDFDRVIEINLKGTFLVTKAVTPYMMKKRDGKIVNLASVVGVTGNAGQCNYSASKAGIIGFTKSIAKELASRNIRVNAVAPGFIDTDMTNVLGEDIKKSINSQIPMKRMGTSREIANVVYFLGNEESSYITGQVINIDGGMVM